MKSWMFALLAASTTSSMDTSSSFLPYLKVGPKYIVHSNLIFFLICNRLGISKSQETKVFVALPSDLILSARLLSKRTGSWLTMPSLDLTWGTFTDSMFVLSNSCVQNHKIESCGAIRSVVSWMVLCVSCTVPASQIPGRRTSAGAGCRWTCRSQRDPPGPPSKQLFIIMACATTTAQMYLLPGLYGEGEALEHPGLPGRVLEAGRLELDVALDRRLQLQVRDHHQNELYVFLVVAELLVVPVSVPPPPRGRSPASCPAA